MSLATTLREMRVEKIADSVKAALASHGIAISNMSVIDQQVRTLVATCLDEVTAKPSPTIHLDLGFGNDETKVVTYAGGKVESIGAHVPKEFKL